MSTTRPCAPGSSIKLFAAAAAVPGTCSIRAVLVIDDSGERTELVRQAVKRCTHALAGCTVNAGTGKDVMRGGAELLTRPDGVRHTVGSLTHALTVRADSDPERLLDPLLGTEHAFPGVGFFERREVAKLADRVAERRRDRGGPTRRPIRARRCGVTSRRSRCATRRRRRLRSRAPSMRGCRARRRCAAMATRSASCSSRS